MPHPRTRPAPADQTGVTLIEVMIAMVLAGLLVIGMNSLWVVAARSLDDVTLRQKAVMRLNGEMERLSSLYLFGTGPTAPVNTIDYAATGVPAERGSYIADAVSDLRTIYGTGQTGVVTMAADAATFATALLADGSNANTVYQPIYYDANGTGDTADDRNLVWLDRERSIVGQISWTLLDLVDTGPMGSKPCLGAACQLLTLYLDFPFRFSTSVPRGAMGPVETITLQTIVGRRMTP